MSRSAAGPGSRPARRSRSRSQIRFRIVGTTLRQALSTGWRGLAALALLALAACSSTSSVTTQNQVTSPQPPLQPSALTQNDTPEHKRILAAYGGAYQDEKLQ